MYCLVTFLVYVLGKMLRIHYTINFILRVQNYLKVGMSMLVAICLTTVIMDALVFRKGNTKKNWLLYLYLLLVHGIIFLSTLSLVYLNLNRAKQCHNTALTFHDFLINYKATPRSRLLRKHMP